MSDLIWQGKRYTEVSADSFPFGNACNHCAFKGTDCYDQPTIDCHSDSRPDGKDIIFRFVGVELQDSPTVPDQGAGQ